MVDPNTTIISMIDTLNIGEHIKALVNSVKVLIGGVFGIYLIILYLRWKEYRITNKILNQVREDIRELASKQGIKLSPINKKRGIRKSISKKLEEKSNKKKTDQKK